MNSKVLSGTLVVVLLALAALSGAEVAAAPNSGLWSVVVHFAYIDGSEYDYVIATGIPTREVASYLAECGRSHRTGSVVRYHCYAIPE